MTDHYARLHDQTVRRHWEQARKVNIAGQQVTLDPGGPLADAAWAKDRLARARSAGYARRTSGDASSSPSRTANSGQKGSTAKRHYRLPRSRPSQERLALPLTSRAARPVQAAEGAVRRAVALFSSAWQPARISTTNVCKETGVLAENRLTEPSSGS